MIKENILDNSNGWLIFCVSVILMLIINFVGYRLGVWHKKQIPETPTTSITDIMGAIFGLLGFTMALLFSMSLTRLQHKKEMIQDEALAILNAYQKCQYLPEVQKNQAQKQLVNYAELRYQLAEAAREDHDMNALRKGIQLSERIQDSLLHEGIDNTVVPAKKETAFLESIFTLVNLHVKRISRSTVDRIPVTLKFMLYFMSLLGLGAIGYAAAMKGGRALIPNIILVIVFSVMIGMIMDMDNPTNTFFHISQQPIKDVITRMNAMHL